MVHLRRLPLLSRVTEPGAPRRDSLFADYAGGHFDARDTQATAR
jgi:hypothetical protein